MLKPLVCSLLSLAAAGVFPRPPVVNAPLAFESHLTVNDRSNARVAVRASQEEGEQEISHLIRQSAPEESWLFDPIAGVWYDCGYRSHYDGVEPDRRFITAMIHSRKYLLHYHSHPAERVRPNILLQPLDWALPSANDINNMIIGTLFMRHEHPDGSFRSRVGSLYGVTEYGLTADGVRVLGRCDILEIREYAEQLRTRIGATLTTKRQSIDDMLAAGNDGIVWMATLPYPGGTPPNLYMP